MSRPEPLSSGLNPLLQTLDAGTALVRVHPAARGLLTFNPTPSEARFRPILRSGGTVVPTMYAATDVETAIAEGLLRTADAGAGRRRLFRVQLDDLACGEVQLTRALALVRLHGPGLPRLGLKRGDIIDSDASAYPWTARWAQALHDDDSQPDGLIWTSRQNDSARALILWGDRVGRGDLVSVRVSLRLDREPGLDLVRAACNDAGVELEA